MDYRAGKNVHKLFEFCQSFLPVRFSKYQETEYNRAYLSLGDYFNDTDQY